VTRQNQEAGKILLLHDVTEDRQREQELKRQNERLEEFASVVSHDLRSPLSVASGRLKLARTDCDTEHLDAIEQAHTRMNTLIDDLLALAREGKQVSETEQVDLGTLFEVCWRNVDTAEAAIHTEIEGTIQADRSRLQQLLENLLRNAVDHGGENVTVTAGQLDDGFYIEDDGPGIPKADQDDVFEAGYSTSEEGTGFGLNIVKEIVAAHDWEIRVTESADGGARFEITGMEITVK
jgi:signal transduction histidine kinase